MKQDEEEIEGTTIYSQQPSNQIKWNRSTNPQTHLLKQMQTENKKPKVFDSLNRP